jgi:hypothetical protein
VWRVESGGQHVDVAQVLELARLETTERGVALRRRRFATDKATIDTMFALEDLDDVLAMLYTGCEDQTGIPASGVLDDFDAGRLHQRFLVHQRFDFVGHELTGANMQTRGVGLRFAGLTDQRA